jgi:hypothetical protein
VGNQTFKVSTSRRLGEAGMRGEVASRMAMISGNQKAWERQPFFEDEDDDEDEALSRGDLCILAEDGLEGTGGVGSFAFVAEADLVGNATGFDGNFESDGHSDGVGGNGDGGIH